MSAETSMLSPVDPTCLQGTTRPASGVAYRSAPWPGGQEAVADAPRVARRTSPDNDRPGDYSSMRDVEQAQDRRLPGRRVGGHPEFGLLCRDPPGPRDGERGHRAEGHDDGADEHGRHHAVDEGLRAGEAALAGEDGRQDGHAEDAAQLADGVAGARRLALLLRPHRAQSARWPSARRRGPCRCPR